MMNSPRVSVCIPTYNGARFIRAALDSVLNQSCSGFELIVSDDNSVDGTLAMVSSYRDERIRPYSNQTCLGLVGNWNRCLDLAQGEYVCLFHQDDLMLPGNLQQMGATLDAHPSVGFVFSNITTIDANGAVIGGHWTDVLPREDTVFPGHVFFELLLAEGNVVPCSSVFARRSLFNDYGGFDQRLRYTPDLEMWLCLSLHCDVAYLAEPLVALRRHARQESAHFAGKTREVDEVWRALRIIFTEHRAFIHEPAEMYDVALDHMQDWMTFFIRKALMSNDPRVVPDFTLLKARFYLAQRRGLSGVSPVAAGHGTVQTKSVFGNS